MHHDLVVLLVCSMHTRSSKKGVYDMVYSLLISKFMHTGAPIHSAAALVAEVKKRHGAQTLPMPRLIDLSVRVEVADSVALDTLYPGFFVKEGEGG